MEVRKTALRLLIASIVISGTLAIMALVTGEFGRLQAQVLLSALATSGASICGMACGAAWDQKRWRSAALGGLGTVLLTLTITLIAVWFEPDPIETWMKVVATGWLFSVAAAHASLLGLARTDELLGWVRFSSVALGFVLAFGITLPIWSSTFEDNTGYFRGLGVVGVLMLTGSLSLPVAARLRGLPDNSEPPGDLATQVMCPSCGHVQSTPLGLVECASCGARFRIELA
jgi:hypothetical protein